MCCDDMTQWREVLDRPLARNACMINAIAAAVRSFDARRVFAAARIENGDWDAERICVLVIDQVEIHLVGPREIWFGSGDVQEGAALPLYRDSAAPPRPVHDVAYYDYVNNKIHLRSAGIRAHAALIPNGNYVALAAILALHETVHSYLLTKTGDLALGLTTPYTAGIAVPAFEALHEELACWFTEHADWSAVVRVINPDNAEAGALAIERTLVGYFQLLSEYGGANPYLRYFEEDSIRHRPARSLVQQLRGRYPDFF